MRTDNRAGGSLAVDHLVARGRRRIAFVGPGWQTHHAFHARRAGYADALERHGLTAIDVEVAAGGDRKEQGAAAVAALLAAGQAFDAIFATSDAIAAGAVEELRRSGIDVPGAVSVVGFDGGVGSRIFYPSLTSVEQDVAQAGEMLVAALVEQRGGDGDHGVVPSRLVCRESS